MSGGVAFNEPSLGTRASQWWLVAAGVVLLVLEATGLYMTVTLTVVSTFGYSVLLLIAGPAEIIEAVAQSRGSEP